MPLVDRIEGADAPLEVGRSLGFRPAAAAAMMLTLLAGCAPSPRLESTVSPPPAASAQAVGWRKVGFEIAWPEKSEPLWYMDTLLAHRIVAPVLKRYRHGIDLWRFHRRAARDGYGHRFSFILYTSADTAYRVFKALKETPLLEELLKEGKLARVDFDDLSDNPRPKVADTSNSAWPSMVQKTWPRFIMGASEMWLGLIDESVASLEKEGVSGDETLYRQVQENLSALWKEEGQHPFLHHLNALFGYEEMIVIDRNGKAMRF